MVSWFNTDHIHKDFWKFVGLFGYVFLLFPAFIVWSTRRSSFFKTFQQLQRDYPLSKELKKRVRPRWVGIPFVKIGSSTARFMLCECQKDGFFFLRPSIFLRAAGLRSVAIPARKVRGNNYVRHLRLKNGKRITLDYGSVF